jgi:predicted nuclease of predicted toxin-antitoxin system
VRFLLDENVSYRVCAPLVSCDHDFVQILFASGDTRPSPLLMREVDTLPSAEIASLLLATMSSELTELLSAGANATLTPDRARVRPLPLRKDAAS